MDNERTTMKKVLLVLTVVAVGAMLFSSCGSSHSCPAYSKTHQVKAERPA